MGRICIGVCTKFKSTAIPNGLKYKLVHKRCSHCGLIMYTKEQDVLVANLFQGQKQETKRIQKICHQDVLE
jgi:hypothetical protein